MQLLFIILVYGAMHGSRITGFLLTTFQLKKKKVYKHLANVRKSQ